MLICSHNHSLSVSKIEQCWEHSRIYPERCPTKIKSDHRELETVLAGDLGSHLGFPYLDSPWSPWSRYLLCPMVISVLTWCLLAVTWPHLAPAHLPAIPTCLLIYHLPPTCLLWPQSPTTSMEVRLRDNLPRAGGLNFMF